MQKYDWEERTALFGKKLLIFVWLWNWMQCPSP